MENYSFRKAQSVLEECLEIIEKDNLEELYVEEQRALREVVVLCQTITEMIGEDEVYDLLKGKRK